MAEEKKGGVWPTVKPFVNGDASGILATCVIQPIDMIKMPHYTCCTTGVLAPWKGAGPTVVRTMALNMGMLASYDQGVEFFKDSLGFGEAAIVLVSGFFAAACSLPFDYVNTQIQKLQPDAEGKFPYTGSLVCTMKTLQAGGPFKFYTGFPVFSVKIVPNVRACRDLSS